MAYKKVGLHCSADPIKLSCYLLAEGDNSKDKKETLLHNVDDPCWMIFLSVELLMSVFTFK